MARECSSHLSHCCTVIGSGAEGGVRTRNPVCVLRRDMRCQLRYFRVDCLVLAAGLEPATYQPNSPNALPYLSCGGLMSLDRLGSGASAKSSDWSALRAASADAG